MEMGEEIVLALENPNNDWEAMEYWVHTASSTYACVHLWHTFICKIGSLSLCYHEIWTISFELSCIYAIELCEKHGDF